MSLDIEKCMAIAFEEAESAMQEGEIPVGAALFHGQTGKLIAKAHNKTLQNVDPTWHAEMDVIKNACKTLETTYLNDYVLFTTLEPCAMCASAYTFEGHHALELAIEFRDHMAPAENPIGLVVVSSVEFLDVVLL